MAKAYWIAVRMNIKDMDTAIACHDLIPYQKTLKKIGWWRGPRSLCHWGHGINRV